MTTPIRFNPEPCVRIFWEDHDPLAFSRSSIGNRFDPLPYPWESTRVLYVGTSLETAVAEALLRWQGQITPGESLLLSESAQLRPRRVAHIVPKRTLTVIDATGLGLAPIEKAIKTALEHPEYAARWSACSMPIADDIFQCGADEYSLTQAWGAWFRSQCPDADGLTWVSRQFNVGRCVVLFEDRCGGQLELAEKPRPLYAPGSPERNVVDRMLAQLNWGVQL